MKNNINLRNKNNKVHLRDCFTKSLKYNDEALDFVENKIHYLEDVLTYNEKSSEAQYELDQYKYIHIVLSKTGEMYSKGLKECGGNV